MLSRLTLRVGLVSEAAETSAVVGVLLMVRILMNKEEVPQEGA